ncbi:MAG: right-handed parallel beta-helix repeat-containing protein, partial [Candidatus Thermoplasmatota archaeon]|nr:right-handed parallel beta-helix repeat-containing protein [Candidatus Thermoplasmatota archaeon]
MRRIIAVWLVMTMLVGGTLGFVNLSTSAEEVGNGDVEMKSVSTSQSKSYTSHDPIYINGNDNFTDANGVVSGLGTQGNPYIIEGWDINANTTDGIYIENTNVYFIIRNCVVHDGWIGWGDAHYGGDSYYGIYLSDVSNGTIDNVTSYNNWKSINVISHSNNNTISNCDVHNNRYGIQLWSSSNNNLTNCYVYNNSYGIHLRYSSNNNLTNCAVYNYNHSGDGISLDSSSNNQITNCTVYDNSDGIYIYYSSDNQIIDCTAYNNSDGIELEYSSNNQISDCTVYGNYRGIYVYYYSNFNRITDCILDNWYGIYVYYFS